MARNEADVFQGDIMQTTKDLRAKRDEIKKEAQEILDHLGGKEEKRSAAAAIVDLVSEAELFHTPDGQSFARLKVNGHFENWPIRSKGFKGWITGSFYREEGRPPTAQALNDALNVIEAKARFEGGEAEVHIRVAGNHERIFIDLGDPHWRAVEVTKEGWRIVDDPPVRFRRTRGMLPLPDPVRGGSIKDLRSFVNVANDHDFRLLVAVIIAAMRPKGPYPALILSGEQGSAKSTTERVIRSIVDPNVAPIRAFPKDERDLMIAAKNGWMIAFDNLSGLSGWLSDALCRLSTGGGLSTRELYTDEEEVLFSAMRPIILNGIPVVAERNDLIDRAVFLTLPPIPEGERRDEEEFWRTFESKRPFIFGAVLDLMASAMAEGHNVVLRSKPRMADFTKLGVAVERAAGWPKGAFLEAYADNRNCAVQSSIEDSAVAQALIQFMDDKDDWGGTLVDLLAMLTARVGEKIAERKDWPKQTRSFGSALKRTAPALRVMGLWIGPGKPPREPGKGLTRIHIEKGGKSPSRSSQTSGNEENHGLGCEDSKADDLHGSSLLFTEKSQNDENRGVCEGREVCEEAIPLFSGDRGEVIEGEDL